MIRSTQEHKLGREVADEELLLRLVMAPDLLESVRAAGEAPAWNGSGTSTRNAAPVHNLGDVIRAVNDLPNWKSLEIRRGTQHIRLRRRDADTGKPSGGNK